MYAQTICRILCLTELFCRHYEMIIEDYYSYSCSGMNKGKDIRRKRILTGYSKNSLSSIGGRLIANKKMNGSGGRREIGISH